MSAAPAATRPEDDPELAGRVAIVTGGGAAGDGIGNGRAACILLARSGTRVLVVDRDEGLAKRTNHPGVKSVATAMIQAEKYGTPLGTAEMDCTALTSPADKDKCDWNNALFGAAETKGTVTLGAMNGARGCITNPVTAMPREVVVAVAWQGMAPTFAPGATTCGQGDYGADDRVRRAMVARITIGCLQNDPATGLCVTP